MPDLMLRNTAVRRTAEAFGRQWSLQQDKTFEDETIYGETPEAELESFIDRFEIRSEAQLHGKRILDVGCGSGRLTANLARRFPESEIIGGDVSDSAFLAFQRCRQLPNAHIARFDLHHAPFPPDHFDFIYADGVLPHVPDAELALAKLVALLRPGGELFVWIYPRSFSPYRLLRDVLVQPHRLPQSLQRAVCWAAGVPLFLAFKLYEPWHGRRRRSLGEVIFMIHDNIVPEYQHRYHPSEMLGLFQKHGLDQLRSLEPAVGIHGRRPPGRQSETSPQEPA